MKDPEERKSSKPASSTLPQGDFSSLFQKYYGSLIGFFLKRGLSRSDSEDLAQETLARAFQAYPKFRRESSDATWLYRIAGRSWKNFLRDQRAHKRDGHNFSLDSTEAVATEMENRLSERRGSGSEHEALAAVLNAEFRQHLDLATQELPPRMGRAIRLFIANYKYVDIADILDVKIGTVKSLIFQAKNRLPKILRERHPELFETEEADDDT